MHFGVSCQSHIDNSWKHAVLAEQLGFTHVWFVDTQMLASDVYACMTLAAEHTRTIRLGTAVAIAGTRIAPVIAHSIATVNQLAPGRVILGLGTGHTAWRAMGMPPVRLDTFRHTIEVCRGLLCGEEVAYREHGRQSRIRFLDRERGYINVRDPIPIYLAASHPKALALAGELGDGLITISTLSPDLLKATLASVASGRARQLSQEAAFPVVTVAVSCVLRAGEAVESPRVRARVGPRIAVALHYAYELVRQGKSAPSYLQTFLTPAYCAYLETRWSEIHTTHSRFLQPGEKAFITPAAIQTMSLTGTREDIIAHLKQLEAAGLTQIVISPPWGYVEESLVEFAREIIAHY
ncbi:MAG: LLM class flavin-dependent oxidoreductase [Deltaproteobacteria bacterium]|nr:LLM class flavin-dependent oxidoreductase [Deltaproteobacteria bacterium]